MHEAEQLWSDLSAAVEPYPAGVLPVPEPIIGTAFFPGGFGLWNPAATKPLPPMPRAGVMVLGQDFHSEEGYRESLEQGFESPTQPTWFWLARLLGEAGIDPARCYFTNAYMGLRAEGKTGRFPGASSPAFVERCRKFLGRQLAIQRPRAILTLGLPAARFLASLSSALTDWTKALGMRQIDVAGPVRQGARFHGVPDLEATVVALTHPSLRPANVRRRRWENLAGHDAELAMIRKAMFPIQGQEA